MTTRIKDLVGQRFGRLVVTAFSGGEWWLCECDCGGKHVGRRSGLTSGETQSCGCLTKERLHEAWAARLEKPNVASGKILAALRLSGGMTNAQLRNLLQRSLGRERIDTALATLERYGKIRRERRPNGGRGGPRVEIWTAKEELSFPAK
jgi:hypothetical protein